MDDLNSQIPQVRTPGPALVVIVVVEFTTQIRFGLALVTTQK